MTFAPPIGNSHLKTQLENFFDAHPRFYKTSSTTPLPNRLNRRYDAIIRAHQEQIRDQRILDIASHDGRWSFAALESDAKHVLGIEGRPENVLFYATSNRRHLMPREMIENERSTAINPAEAVEEKVSLSDRFGLWLGFHACDQDVFLAIVDGYAGHYGLKVGRDRLHADAIEWSVTRGARSGRVAWQFIQDLAGRLGQKLG